MCARDDVDERVLEACANILDIYKLLKGFNIKRVVVYPQNPGLIESQTHF